jgi:hypothetical protein
MSGIKFERFTVTDKADGFDGQFVAHVFLLTLAKLN